MPTNQWCVVGSGSVIGFGPVAEVAARELGGDRAGDGEVGDRHLLAHRPEVAFEELGRALGGVGHGCHLDDANQRAPGQRVVGQGEVGGEGHAVGRRQRGGSGSGVHGGGRYSHPVPSTPDDKLPIKMVNDRLLVRIPDKDGERRSQGGILIPATAQMAKRLVWAEVVALGQNVRVAEVGDLVLFSPEDRYEVEVQGTDYIMLRERDLHAVAAERIEASTGPLSVTRSRDRRPARRGHVRRATASCRPSPRTSTAPS